MDEGNVGRTSTSVDEDISQFAVDNNFQADFATGDIRHTLLLGLDHQRSNTNYTSIFGDGLPTNVNNPIYGQPIVRPDRSRRFTTTTRRPTRPACTCRIKWPSTSGA
jgi:iron complex outermembrane receptor protein